jgi:hypothetical protein
MNTPTNTDHGGQPIDLSTFLIEIREQINEIREIVDSKKNKLLTKEEFMAKIRISGTTFWRLQKTGRIQFKKIGQRIFIPASEAEKYIGLD